MEELTELGVYIRDNYLSYYTNEIIDYYYLNAIVQSGINNMMEWKWITITNKCKICYETTTNIWKICYEHAHTHFWE